MFVYVGGDWRDRFENAWQTSDPEPDEGPGPSRPLSGGAAGAWPGRDASRWRRGRAPDATSGCRPGRSRGRHWSRITLAAAALAPVS